MLLYNAYQCSGSLGFQIPCFDVCCFHHPINTGKIFESADEDAHLPEIGPGEETKLPNLNDLADRWTSGG